MKNIDAIKISVIVPVYNVEKYVEQTLDCLANQTHENLEIIAVMDGGTDNSENIVRAYRDTRIKIVTHDRNRGLSVARNTGVQNATGDYIHFMDGDDLLNPKYYENMLKAIVETGSEIAVSGIYKEKSPRTGIIYENEQVLWAPQEKFNKTFVGTYGYAVRYLINRAWYNENKFAFLPELKTMEDKQLMIQVIYAGRQIVLVPDSIYLYKYREGSILTTRDPARKKLLKQNRHYAKQLVRDFMKTHQLKTPSKIWHYIKGPIVK
ncbi:beta-1,3-N-acetylglucosaminyltransferase [Candidatus Symbiothrix dinenymphae]|nr:beta-1,3-N-acetylglucosaminyltransferase [Candidatus Symbiothrix dinenymphae]